MYIVQYVYAYKIVYTTWIYWNRKENSPSFWIQLVINAKSRHNSS